MLRRSLVPMVKVVVNGRPMELQGDNLLDGLNKAGVDVPHVCWHPDLKKSGGVCRVCVCRVNGKMQATCKVPLAEGQEVQTADKEVMDLRRASFALLLRTHPSICLSCEGNQNCKIQKLCAALALPCSVAARGIMDVERERTTHVQRRPSLDPSSVLRINDLCINCGLCIQACANQNVGAIGALRDSEEENPTITTFKGLLMPETECIMCGQCINVCPTGALQEASEIDAVARVLQDGKKVKVFQFAPSVRVSLAEEFGYKPGERNLEGEMTAAARMLCGKDKVLVFDTNFTADLTIVEEGYELLGRLAKTLGGKSPGSENITSAALPMITSCSPGWILYCEKNYHDLLPNLSTCKSPQQMAGALVKHIWGPKQGIASRDIESISIMPCTAKKAEKTRPEFSTEGVPDVDHVLTTREFAKLLRMYGIDPTKVQPEAFDSPLGISTGAGLIFGATGGVMEAALRTVYEVVTGKSLIMTYSPVRGMDGVKEGKITITDAVSEYSWLDGVELSVAVAHGTANAKKLCDRIRSCKEEGLPPPWHFVEVMACPGGCLGGGGQPKPTNWEVKMKRASLIYTGDAETPLRKSHENPAVQELYTDELKEPGSHRSHDLLHTTYTGRTTPGEVSWLGSEVAKELRWTVLNRYPPKSRAYLTNLLAEVVDKYGYISDDALCAVGHHIGVGPMELESIVSHYHFFPRTPQEHSVYLCECHNCRMHGAKAVRDAFRERGIRTRTASWLGWCVHGPPAGLVKHKGDPRVHAMLDLTPEKVRRLGSEDIAGFVNPDPPLRWEVRSTRAVAGGEGGEDPPSLMENIAVTEEDAVWMRETGQCPVSRKAFGMAPEEIVAAVKRAQLTGRGGAGFPTHIKLGAVAREVSEDKYVVVNADEGLPCTFKDYFILQHPGMRTRMVAGVSIAAHAVGARRGVIYLRYEYRNLRGALEETIARYQKVLNPSSRLQLRIVTGAGPYVCGEETALMESIEGHLPQARTDRSSFPTHKGLFGKPTLVSNVETYACIPKAVYETSAWSGGEVKLFSICGDVERPVVAEFPMGMTVREVLQHVGVDVSQVKACEVGGAVDPIVPNSEFDRRFGKDLMGTGSVVVLGKSFESYKDIQDKLFRWKAKFAAVESCQLCAPCRDGTKLFRHVLPGVLSGTVSPNDSSLRIAMAAMEASSNCAHGKGCGAMSRRILDDIGSA
eukprot:Sspe_Gene.8422::Locus_2865_Transcript_1_1_Confidence_1.000_Length_5789::g.8422::m.8422